MKRDELKKYNKAKLIELALHQQTLIEDLQGRSPVEAVGVQSEEKGEAAGEHHSRSHSHRSHHKHRSWSEKLSDRFTQQQRKNFRIVLFILLGILITLIAAFVVSSGAL